MILKVVQPMVALMACAALSAAAVAQEPENPIKHMAYPHVTEKHKMLEVMAGDWTIKGHTFKGCPYGEGEFTGKEHNEMMKGGLFLVSRTQYSELFKNSNQIAFFGVDPQTEQYTYALYSNLGVSIQAAGATKSPEKKTLMGNAIEWTQKKVNVDMHGDQPTMVYTTEMISPNKYTFKLMAGGGTWYIGEANRVDAVNPNPTRQ
jgi:hypothetical protein